MVMVDLEMQGQGMEAGWSRRVPAGASELSPDW